MLDVIYSIRVKKYVNLRDLIPFVQFKKREKLLHRCFLRFLNRTKSRNTSHVHTVKIIKLDLLVKKVSFPHLSLARSK